MPRYTLCYRFYRYQFLRKLSFHAPFKALDIVLKRLIPITN